MTPQEQARFGDLKPSRWPGERLGLPRSGPRSVAGAWRRIGALAADWALAMLVAQLLFEGNSLAILGVFLVMQTLGLIFFAGGLGHLLLRMRLVRLDGVCLGIWRPFLRSFLLCLLLPALVWDSDQRGFHDKLSGTVLVCYKRRNASRFHQASSTRPKPKP